MNIKLPPEAAQVLAALRQRGFPAYAVGGGVRDSLLGRRPGDWDIATAALPQQVHAALAPIPVVDTGLRHGTVTALLGGRRLEITTFRVDGAYSDHRRPDSVVFTRSLREDLARRDFTMNAMAYAPEEGLIDPFGGEADLRRGVIRAVGQPDRRFQEDALRILRGLRFSAVLGFPLEEQTAQAMDRQRQLLAFIAPERIQAGLCLLLPGPAAEAVLRRHREVFAVLLPELAPMFDFDQCNRHHIYDVWEHTLHAFAAVPPELTLRLTLLLHDCGKPQTFWRDGQGEGHFYGHAAVSARLARQALARLRFERTLAERVERLIYLHDHDILPTEKAMLRWLRRVGEEELRLLLQVKRADNRGQSPEYDRTDQYDAAEAALDAVLAKALCFSRGQLALRGGDLLRMGLSGPAVGQALDWLVDQVIDGALPNEREALLCGLQSALDLRHGSMV